MLPALVGKPNQIFIWLTILVFLVEVACPTLTYGVDIKAKEVRVQNLVLSIKKSTETAIEKQSIVGAIDITQHATSDSKIVFNIKNAAFVLRQEFKRKVAGVSFPPTVKLDRKSNLMKPIIGGQIIYSKNPQNCVEEWAMVKDSTIRNQLFGPISNLVSALVFDWNGLRHTKKKILGLNFDNPSAMLVKRIDGIIVTIYIFSSEGDVGNKITTYAVTMSDVQTNQIRFARVVKAKGKHATLDINISQSGNAKYRKYQKQLMREGLSFFTESRNGLAQLQD